MGIDPTWLEADFYEVLGVSPDAERWEITSAYRRLARQLHPDANPGPESQDRFAGISRAYAVLGDPEQRSAYDRARRMATSGTRPRPGGGYTIRVDRVGEPEPRRPSGRDGAEATVTVPITFAEAVRGTDVVVPVGGRPLTLRIPPGTPSGRVLRVPDRGLPGRRGGDDLLVTVQVHVPRHLNARQRELIDELARFDDPEALRAHLRPGTGPTSG